MIENLNKDRANSLINGKSILITGGTGTFGNELLKILLNEFSPSKIIIFSRDEFKQSLMMNKYPPEKYPQIRFFIGDIRDYERLCYAFNKVNIVFHAAALKQVPALEYNPTEAVKTNIYGAENVIRAAIKNNVSKVIAISTDKSVNPVNLYGATKMCFEKLFINANYLSGNGGTVFSVLRYGNVFGSRGSVAPFFLKNVTSNILTITDPRMTRFNLTIRNAIYFVLNSASIMIGGEIFVPKLPSYNIMQLAKLIGPNCEYKIIGIRPGEKLHETMIGENESYLAMDLGNFFVILPIIQNKLFKDYEGHYKSYNPKSLESGYSYNSGDNELISDEKLKECIDELVKELT